MIKLFSNCILAIHLFSFVDNHFDDKYPYEQQFGQHIRGFDELYTDDDPFSPSFVYVRQGKVVGMEYNGGPAYGPYDVRVLLDNNQQPIQGFTRIIINTPEEASEEYPRGLWRVEYKTGGTFLYDDNDNGSRVIAMDIEKSQLYYLNNALEDYRSWKKITQCSQIYPTNYHCKDNPKFNK